MLRAGVSCLEPNDYNYGNDDFERGFQGATGLTMRFRQPQAHGATAHGYGARIRKPTDTAHGYGARIMYPAHFLKFRTREMLGIIREPFPQALACARRPARAQSLLPAGRRRHGCGLPAGGGRGGAHAAHRADRAGRRGRGRAAKGPPTQALNPRRILSFILAPG